MQLISDISFRTKDSRDAQMTVVRELTDEGKALIWSSTLKIADESGSWTLRHAGERLKLNENDPQITRLSSLLPAISLCFLERPSAFRLGPGIPNLRIVRKLIPHPAQRPQEKASTHVAPFRSEQRLGLGCC
jgi:hypothetical protein